MFKIKIIHDNFSLDPTLFQEVMGRTLSLGLEKTKFSKCSILNQISGEGYLWLVWVLYGIIFSIQTQKSDLFMTQVDFMLFLRLWIWLIQALPNLVRCFPNLGILFPNSPNMYRKYNKCIYNMINNIFSLILNLLIDSSPWFSRKNIVFQCKTFSNLVFRDDFSFDGTIWLSYDFIFVWRAIWHPPLCWITK
jgi:hypothetical protein